MFKPNLYAQYRGHFFQPTDPHQENTLRQLEYADRAVQKHTRNTLVALCLPYIGFGAELLTKRPKIFRISSIAASLIAPISAYLGHVNNKLARGYFQMFESEKATHRFVPNIPPNAKIIHVKD